MPDSRGRESAYVRAGLGPRERFRAMNREPSVMARPLLKCGHRGDRRMRRASEFYPDVWFPGGWVSDGFRRMAVDAHQAQARAAVCIEFLNSPSGRNSCPKAPDALSVPSILFSLLMTCFVEIASILVWYLVLGLDARY